MKRALKIVGYSIGLLLFLLTVLAGFTQSKLFRDRLRVFLVSAITTNTNATLTLGTIRGNFVTGFTIDSLRMHIGENEFLSTGKIAITYDFLSLLQKRIIVHSLTIEHPRIVLQREETDSIWNIENLVKPTERDEPSPFDWTIQVDELQLINGSAIFKDQLALSSPEHSTSLPHQVEYHDVSISNLILKCSGKYADEQAHLVIQHFSFDSYQPLFELRNLRGDFSISPTGAEAKSLVIETAHTRLKLSAALEQVNLFDGIELEQLQHKRTKLSLLADNISLNELKSFIAPIDFLNGSTYIDLDVSGEFGNLAIDRLNLQTYNTAIKLAGAIQNLHKPDDLFMNVDIQDSRITPSDADKLLPPFHIPRFAHAGSFLLNGKFSGKPLNFVTSIQIDGNAGALTTDVKLNLEKEKMEYDCLFHTKNFVIGKILDVTPFHTALTSHGSIKGVGTSMEQMIAHLKVTLDSTIVENMILTGSEIVMDVQNHSIQTTAKLNSSETKITLTGNADFKHDQSPLFHLDGEVTNLDLAQLLTDNHFKSKLSFNTHARIEASNIDDLNGSVKIAFSSSSFQTHEFGDEELELNIEQQNPDTRQITLHSPVADIVFSGNFTLSDAIDRIHDEYQNISRAVRNRAELFEHTTISSVARKKTFGSSSISNQAPFNLQYSATIKNIQPLSIFLGGTPFNGRGAIHGSVVFENHQFSLTCSTSVAEIFVGTIDKGTLFEDGDVVFTLSSDEEKQTTNADYLENLTFDLHAFSRYGIINKSRFDNPLVRISHRRDVTNYELRSTIDSLFSLDVSGNVDVSQHAYDFVIDSMAITFVGLSWLNDGSVHALVNRNGIHITKFDVRKDQERITLQGTLDYAGSLDGQLSVREFNLAGLGHYVKMKELISDRGFAGNIDLDMRIQGTLTAPKIHLNTTGTNIAYRGKSIGMLAGLFNYQNQNLDVEVRIGNAKADKALPDDLLLHGNLPINLALGSHEQRFPDKPMSMIIRSEGFVIDVLDPLLTSFDDLRGKLSCNVRVEGTPTQPLYNGTITFSDVQFLFVPNNLPYTLSGRMEASGDKINLADVQISNSKKDRSDGMATVGGSLTIRNFTIESFDLTAHGQLLLMKEATRRALKAMYGTLFASIGSEGLRYRGSFEQSYLSGTVYIKEANLIFPPTRENTYANIETSLNYVVVDDTSRKELSQQKLSQQFFAEHTNGSPQANESIKAFSAATERTIWDGMTYDVLIETQGTTEIRMVFNQATNEELYTALNGRVVLQRGERGAKIVGEIAVAERSYYNFFKKFSANGTLKFVGQPDNPELNITALYDGTRTLPEAMLDTVGTDQKKTEEKVVVTLNITGTRYEPKLSMSMTVDGVAKGGDVESDAIPFILTGKFRDDLTSQEKSDILSIGATAGGSLLYGLPSQMLSGVLSDFLQKEFPIIRRAELTYKGGNIQESADLRLSGELGRAYWRFGGRIFTDIGNANVSFQLSMGEVFSAPTLRNLFIELERKVEGSENEERKKLTNAARIFYRISF